MLSEEEKKAINNLNYIIVTDIYDNEVRIDKRKIIAEYNDSLRITLNLIRNQQSEIEKKDKIIDLTLNLIYQYGGVDGEHHKKWLIDQIVRNLTGNNYKKWIKEYKKGEDGANTYGWDIGIAP